MILSDTNMHQVVSVFRYVKLTAGILAMAVLLPSCDWLGIGGKDDGEDVGGGEVVWRVANEQENTVGTQPLVQGENVYFLQDGYLKAYTLAEGNRIWATQIVQNRDGDYSHSILHDGELLFFDQGFRIKAFNKSNGNEVWETKITEDAEEVSGTGTPIMSQDEQYLYAGRKGYVLKVRKSDGQVMQRYPLDRLVPNGVIQGATEPVIHPDENILYVPTSYFDRSQSTPEEASGGNIFAYEATTGELIWERHVTVTLPDRSTTVPDDSLTGSPFIFDIAVTPEKVIALSGFFIVALDRTTGEPVWKTYFSEGGFDVGLAVTSDAVYAASIGTFATRVDLNTGEKRWKTDIKFSNTSIPTVQNGRMYFNNSGGGGIWVLNTDDGSVIYNQPPPSHATDNFDVYISSLGVGSGYMVNVGSKAVYCLKVP